MGTPGQRLRIIRTSLGLTQKALGERLGLHWYQVKNMELGTVKITSAMAKLISYDTGYNEEWILSGEGEIMRTQADANNITYIDQTERILSKVIARTKLNNDEFDEEMKEFIRSAIKKELAKEIKNTESKVEGKAFNIFKIMEK